MKRKTKDQPDNSEEGHPAFSMESEDAPCDPSLASLDPSSDICDALMRRYGNSTAPQHRHLCASAAAMRSILLEEGLPTSPPAYLATGIQTLSSTGKDSSAASAIASFLSILLPLIQDNAMSHEKSKIDALSLSEFLKANQDLPAGTVRCLVRVLGLLVLHVDKDDWEAVQIPLETLLAFSIDKRPKVRKCAQEFVEKIFTFLKGSETLKKANKIILGIFEKYISSAQKLGSGSNKKKNTQNSDEKAYITHFLHLLKSLAPNLTKKSRKEVLNECFKLLLPYFHDLTRHILTLIESILENLDDKYINDESEKIISPIMSYLSSNKKKPLDTIIQSLDLFKKCLNRFNGSQWTQILPPIFESYISGYSSPNVGNSKDVACILKDLIISHVDEMENSSSSTAISSICSSLNKMIKTSIPPSENVLLIISIMFLKLGDSSFEYMKEILMKLSQLASTLDKEKPIFKHVHECIGCAVISIGVEKVISLIPINFDEEKATFSNTWIKPILNKYILGDSLQFFMDHVVPLADSLKKPSKKDKKGSKQRVVKSWVNGLWGILSAFCRFPCDLIQSFESFTKLLINRLKEDSSLHEIILKSLQELINGNKSLSEGEDGMKNVELFTVLPSEICDIYIKKKIYSQESAIKNMKIMASYSMDFISALSDIFFKSPIEKRAILKETIRSIVLLSESVNIGEFYISLLKKLDLNDNGIEDENLEESEIHDENEKKEDNKDNNSSNENRESKRCLMLELTCTFAEVANKDVLNILLNFIRSSLLNGDESCHAQAFLALSTILKENHEFTLTRVDEIMLLLHNVKSTSDINKDNGTIKNRLSCYQYLLIHMLKANEEITNNKAFLVLNEIIITLKSKKESRSLAYDVLLATSTSLKNNSSDLQRLFTMVMGYLSSPSAHITSGAISALSLLIYNDAEFCLEIPNLIPSVLILLQNKNNEVIKAALGFVKVLVSTLEGEKLSKLQEDILKGILPWSLVSKFHFRAKVGLILEILMRKCGYATVDTLVPQKYKAFVKSTFEARQNKKNLKESDTFEKAPESELPSPSERPKKFDSEKKKGFSEDSNKKNWEIKKHNGNKSKDFGNKAKEIKRGHKFGQKFGSQSEPNKRKWNDNGEKNNGEKKKQGNFKRTKFDSNSNKTKV